MSQSRRGEVKAYLAEHEAHHRRWTYPEEVMVLLKRQGVDFDERYVAGEGGLSPLLGLRG